MRERERENGEKNGRRKCSEEKNAESLLPFWRREDVIITTIILFRPPFFFSLKEKVD